MADNFGSRAGTLHIRVKPKTTGFGRELRNQLRAIEGRFPDFKVKATVDKVKLDRTKVQDEVQRQFNYLKKFEVAVGAKLDTRRVRFAMEEVTQPRKFDLIPDIDRAMLDRLTRQMSDAMRKIEPTLIPDVDSAAVRERVIALQNEFARLERDLNISIISEEHAATIRHRLRQIDEELDNIAKDRTTRIDVNPSTAWASSRLRWLARPRIVEIIPQVSNVALTKAATTLAALSGARLTWNYLDRFSTWMSEVDKKLPALTFGTFGLTTAFSGLMGSISGIVGIGDGLVALLPGLLLAPGLLAGAAVSIVTFAIAFKDAKVQLEELGDGYKNLASIIRWNFWDQARDPIINLSNSVMPQLIRSFTRVSTAAGIFTGRLSDSFSREFAGGRLERMFDGLAASFDELSKGSDAFAGAITNLGLVAAKYMPSIAKWFTDLSIRFDNWLSDVSTDGRLHAWLMESRDALYALWDVAAATSGIFSGIWKAAEAGGGGGLRGFADMLMAWDEAVNGAKWQATLTAMFRGAGTALDGFGDGLERVGEMLYVQRDALELFMGTAGVALGGFIGSIADALSRPSFAAGLDALGEGLAAGLKGIEPALPALADAFGSLLTFIGELASTVGPVLGEALQVLAPLFTDVLDAVTPLLPALGEGFANLISDLAPLLADLTQKLIDNLPEIVSLGKVAIENAPLLLALAGAVIGVSKALGPLFEFIGKGSAFEGMVTAITKTGPFLRFLGPIALVVGAFVGMWNGSGRLRDSMGRLWDSLNKLGGVLEAILEPLGGTSGALDFITNSISGVLGVAGYLISYLVDLVTLGIMPVINGLQIMGDLLGGVIGGVTALFSGDWSGAWEAFSGGFLKAKEDSEQYATDFLDHLKGMFTLEEGERFTEQFGNGMNNGMANALDPTGFDLSGWNTAGLNAVQEFNAGVNSWHPPMLLEPTGAEAPKADWWAPGAEAATTFGNALNTGMAGLVVTPPDMSTAGASMAQGFAGGLTSSSGAVTDAANMLANQAIVAIDKSAKSAKLGADFGNGFGSGISSTTFLVQSTSMQLSQAALASLRTNSTGTYSIGVNFGQGFANGIASQISAAASAAARLAQSASNSAKANLDINSPSRVADREIGQMFGAGYVQGIGKWEKRAQDAAAALTKIPAGVLDQAKASSDFARSAMRRAYTPVAAAAGAQTTNYNGYFQQPDQREQFREFAAFIERERRR